MKMEEKRKKIIEAYQKNRSKYSDDEIRKAIKRTSGALSSLKNANIDQLRTEAVLCR